jgi:hypothetical protein
MVEKSSWDQATRWQKLGLVWRNRKKISQIINDYLYLPFFLLIVLRFMVSTNHSLLVPDLMVRNPFRATTNPARDCELMLAKAVLDYEEMTEYTIQGSVTCFRRAKYKPYSSLLLGKKNCHILQATTDSLQQVQQAFFFFSL